MAGRRMTRSGRCRTLDRTVHAPPGHQTVSWWHGDTAIYPCSDTVYASWRCAIPATWPGRGIPCWRQCYLRVPTAHDGARPPLRHAALPTGCGSAAWTAPHMSTNLHGEEPIQGSHHAAGLRHDQAAWLNSRQTSRPHHAGHPISIDHIAASQLLRYPATIASRPCRPVGLIVIQRYYNHLEQIIRIWLHGGIAM